MVQGPKVNTHKTSSKDFVIFGEDLNRHAHSLEHILKYSFESNRFIWVETIGLRSPNLSLYDLKRVFDKIVKWIFASKKDEATVKYPSVIIANPFIIPYNQYKLVRTVNKWFVAKTLNKLIKDHKFKDIISISSVPQASEYIDSYHSKTKIYFCVDDFSLWPGINHKLAKTFEDALIKKVDLVLASAYELAKNKRKIGQVTQVIGHGVDFEHFNIGKNTVQNEKTQICYFGLIDERMNLDIIFKISDAFSNIQINLFGDIVINKSLFLGRENIKLWGKVLYEDLPQKIKHMDIFILPYQINELTKNINPLKLKEYLSTSRMTISTRLPEVDYYKDYLHLAEGPEEFIQLISKFQTNKELTHNDMTTEYIKNNETWLSKNIKLNQIIDNHKPNVLQ